MSTLKKLMNAKRRKGLAYYSHGFMLVIPQDEAGTVKKLTFTGSFDRRKLRKMVRASLIGSFNVVQLDWLIDNYGTRLRPMNDAEMEALIAEATDASPED